MSGVTGAHQEDKGLQGEMVKMEKMVSLGHLVLQGHRACGDTGENEGPKGKKVMRVSLASVVQEGKLANLARRAQLVSLDHLDLSDHQGLRASEVATGSRGPMDLMGREDWMVLQVCQA